MSQYTPPIKDMMFALYQVAELKDLPGVADFTEEDIGMVLESAGALAAEVLSPLNVVGDRKGPRLENAVVTTPPGFKEAYKKYTDGGWNGVPFDPAHGGQGLPWPVAFAVQEMWQAANMGFGLCPMLTQAAVEAVETHGTPEQKKTYLEKLVSGEWTGTMNLTEPDAGTDLGAVKSRAEKQTDGTYLIRGQKIFITYGEHDYTDNIIHTVLARTPDAPEGIKGISMFIVPKFLPDADGRPGRRNDVKCVSIEHKLGIHASPTCTMQYGDEGGAVGFLIGKENEGIKYMFTMMNNARLSVGLQGVAIAESAYQHAVTYARGRVQGTRAGDKSGRRVAIIEHPDVQRMLMLMKCQIEAARALTYEAAKLMDQGRHGDKAAQAQVDLLTPVVKAWGTNIAQEVASTALQVHGGMGFIEETGAAQFFRDARITPIYEGTNGIQALDLCFRKIVMDGGAAVTAWFAQGSAHIKASGGADEKILNEALANLKRATDYILAAGKGGGQAEAAGVAVPYLEAFGAVAGGIIMARSAQAARSLSGDPDFAAAKLATAAFYMSHILPRHAAAVETVLRGGAAVAACKPEWF